MEGRLQNSRECCRRVAVNLLLYVCSPLTPQASVASASALCRSPVLVFERPFSIPLFPQPFHFNYNLPSTILSWDSSLLHQSPQSHLREGASRVFNPFP